MENYTPDEMINMILDGNYNMIKKGENLVDEMCGKLHKEAEENEIDEVPAPVGQSMDQLEDEITEQPKCPSGFQFCPIRKKCIPVPKGQGVRTGKGRNPTGVPTPRKGAGLNPVRQGRGQQKESVVTRIKETYHGLEEREKTAYQKFFMSMLKKHGVTSPSQLKGDKKKKFFDDIDKKWKAKKEGD